MERGGDWDCCFCCCFSQGGADGRSPTLISVMASSNTRDAWPPNYAPISGCVAWWCRAPERRLSRPADVFIRSHVRRHSASASSHPIVEVHISGGREMDEIATEFDSPTAMPVRCSHAEHPVN